MIGHTLGRYTIESKIGEGGMGVVYKARDTQLDRPVAIKVLPPDKLADPDRKRRFIQEARAASALNHPGIVTVHDIGTDAGRDFIVMEYLQGETLDHLTPAAGLKVTQALRYGSAIADALARAHDAGIVHRDLKPSNIMVTTDGRVKVLDFGLAKLLEPSTPSATLTTIAASDPGSIVGTTAYMSPEQADGRQLDARSDIFSFGCVLYELLTGRRAFGGDSRLAVLTKIVNDEPAAPSRLAPSIPPDVEKMLLRCLRKDPARRYQTMADLKVALDDLIVDSSSTNQPLPAATRSSKARWRVAVAVIAASVVAGGAFAVLRERRPSGDDAPLQAVPLTSLPGNVRQPALSPNGEHVAFTWSGPSQDNNDIHVQQVGAGTQLRLTTDPGNDHSPAWSPDGRAIAFLRRYPDSFKHELRLIPPLGGAERKVADIQVGSIYRPLAIAWCPDGSCIVVPDLHGGKVPALFAITIDGGARRQLTFPATNILIDTDPAIAPDGRSLVFRRDRTPFTGEMYRQPLGNDLSPVGDPVRLTDVKMSGTKPSWLPNGRDIVFAARGGLWRLDAFSGASPARLPYVGLDGASPSLSGVRPDGTLRLVYLRTFADTNIWRIDTPQAGRPATSPPSRAIASTRADMIPNLSPDGKRLAFFSGRSGESELWVANPDGSSAVQLTFLASVPGFARWSPDSQTLAFHSDPEGRPDVLVIAADGGSPRIVTRGTTSGGYPNFSRDGSSIYFSGQVAPGQNFIHKIPVTGGTAARITTVPGALAIESFDGRDLYFAEAGERASALWRLPLSGQPAEKLFDGVLDTSFDVTDGGIYFIDRSSSGPGTFVNESTSVKRNLQYFDFATRRQTTVAYDVGRVAAGITASRDGRTIFFTRVDSSIDELMLVEKFR